MKKIIAIYTFATYPCGDASANRILAAALCMKSAGYQVIVLTRYKPRKQDYNIEQDKYQYKGIEYRSFYKPRFDFINRNNVYKIYKKNFTKLEQERIYAVFASYRNYGVFLHCLLKIKKIISIVDVREWFSSNKYKYPLLSRRNIVHNYKIRFLIGKAKNIVCISKYLEHYYTRKGCNVLYLPPQIIISDYKKHSLPKMRPLQLFYAGNMGKKDYIWIFLEAMAKLDIRLRKKVKFTLAGCEEKEFEESIPNGRFLLNELKDCLEIIGRISKDEVEERLSNSHFTVLIRPLERYSMAGFPSKIPESLAAGVPVMTNLTSDLPDYLSHMKNSIIIKDFSVDSCLSALNDSLNISYDKFTKMSEEAYNTAFRKFDYKAYNKSMKDYLENL